MEKTKNNESHVIIGHVLGQGEKEHVMKRLETVLNCLKHNGIPCNVDEMPNIAVLGSGGGLRAMVALLGSLGALDEVQLLDSVMYLSGVSGSTWCMSSLYKKQDWSTNLKDLTDDIVKRLVDGKVPFIKKRVELMKYFGESENFSLTHAWAAMIISGVVKEIDEEGVTWQEGYSTKDPYPIYTVIDQKCKHEKQYKDVWFEITPHLSGYSHTGAFVDTKHLGSKFKNGSSTEPQPEMDMLYLQGLCGSALADRTAIFKWISEHVKGILPTVSFSHPKTYSASLQGQRQSSSELLDAETDEECRHLMQHLQWNLTALTAENPSIHVTTLKEELIEGDFDGVEVFKTSWILSECTVSEEDIIKHTLQLCEELQKRCSESDLLSGDCLVQKQNPPKFQDGGMIMATQSWRPFTTLKRLLSLIKKIMELLLNWTWGTTNNFLYSMTDPCCSNLQTETRRYEDTALLVNSPYFSMLREERKVDLIISLDFSDGDPFETLTTTADKCKELNIPFPEVKSGDKENPLDFYVFKGEGPTVIHIPLFNSVNCPGQVQEYRDKYSTIKLNYSDNKIKDLMKKAALNIHNNKEKLLKEIKEIVQQNKKNKA